MKKLLFVLFLLVFRFSSSAQHTNQYCNSAFSFCLQVPGNFSFKGESKTGYGHYFTGKDGSSLAVYGTYNDMPDEPVRMRFEREKAAIANDTSFSNTTQIPVIVKAEVQENSYSILYQHNGLTSHLYRQLHQNQWLNLDLHYPTLQQPAYEQKLKQMVGSIR